MKLTFDVPDNWRGIGMTIVIGEGKDAEMITACITPNDVSGQFKALQLFPEVDDENKA